MGKCITFAFTSIKKRGVRHLLTSVMFAIAMVFAVATPMLYNFSYGKCVSDYILDTGTKAVELVKYSEYVNGLEETVYQYLTRGDYLYDCITETIDEKYIIRVRKNLSIDYGSGKTAGAYKLFSANIVYFGIMNIFMLAAGFAATFIPINKLSHRKVHDLLKLS